MGLQPGDQPLTRIPSSGSLAESHLSNVLGDSVISEGEDDVKDDHIDESGAAGTTHTGEPFHQMCTREWRRMRDTTPTPTQAGAKATFVAGAEDGDDHNARAIGRAGNAGWYFGNFGLLSTVGTAGKKRWKYGPMGDSSRY